MAQKHKAGKPDLILLFTSCILLAIGLIMVLSASSLFAFNQTGNSYSYFFKQVQWAFLGIIAAFGALITPYRYWKKLSGLGIILSIGLLLLLKYSGLAVEAKGSVRWLNIFGMSIQPSEVAKLFVVIFLAHTLTRYPVKKLKDVFLPLVIIGIIVFYVYKQPDLGTAIVILAVCGIMFLMTELSSLYFLATIPICGIAGYYLVKSEPYQWNRILSWLDPWKYASTLGWQSVNAQIALGTGGLFGIGIGRGVESGNLPENFTDMIFAVIGQEFGFFGTFFVIICFSIFFGRAYFISHQCPDRFGRLLGFGLTSLLAVQTVINLGVVTGLLPITGISLPLISYGGSSLLVTLLEIGILLNISRYRENQRLKNNISSNNNVNNVYT